MGRRFMVRPYDYGIEGGTLMDTEQEEELLSLSETDELEMIANRLNVQADEIVKLREVLEHLKDELKEPYGFEIGGEATRIHLWAIVDNAMRGE